MNSETVHFEIKNGYIAVACLSGKNKGTGKQRLVTKSKIV